MTEPVGPIPGLFRLADPNQTKRGHSEYCSSRSVRRCYLLHNKPGDSQIAQENLLVDGTNPRPAQRRATDILISRGRLVVHLSALASCERPSQGDYQSWPGLVCCGRSSL